MNQQSKMDIDLGHFLSLVLRHKPQEAGISLDANGWAEVKELLAGMNQAGKKISMDDLERIVKENNKQRYAFNEDHTRIRANQGHSIPVDVELKAEQPPKELYHGTATKNVDSIKEKGITKQKRQYVHLSSDKKVAMQVGKRHGSPVVCIIDAEKMAEKGKKFHLSENKVWLCDYVPWDCIKGLEYKNS